MCMSPRGTGSDRPSQVLRRRMPEARLVSTQENVQVCGIDGLLLAGLQNLQQPTITSMYHHLLMYRCFIDSYRLYPIRRRIFHHPLHRLVFTFSGGDRDPFRA